LLSAGFTARAIAQDAEVAPPAVVSRVDAAYPPEALAARIEGTVVLQVAIDAAGHVEDASVAESAGEAFDAAALAAVRRWTFTPASRAGVPVASRIRVPFVFQLPPSAGAAPEAPVTAPAPAPATTVVPAPEAARPAEAPAAAPAAEQTVDVTVYGKRAPPPRAPSDFVIARDVVGAAPHTDAGSVLNTAPGVYASRPEGDAVAHEIFLRGFEAEHGQDIAFSAAGMPINLPSQLHGQGYSDLNFIPPEVIRSLRVTEGVYDPRQGDFAIAGSIDFDLGVTQRGLLSRTEYGSFNTLRQVLLWAPEDQDEETFGVAVLRRSDGFGENRGGMSGTGMGQLVIGTPEARTIIHADAYGARADLAGVVRADDVAAGRVGFYDSYDDPSANAQSAYTTRLSLGVRHERKDDSGALTTLGIWLLASDFVLRENLTGYLEQSRLMPEWEGRGDLIEQSNADLAVGASAAYRTRTYRPASFAHGAFETGLSLRSDDIDQAQNLLQAPQNSIWDRRVDATIRGADVGAYVDADWHFTRYLALRGGLRADALFYDVEDRLGDPAAADAGAADALTGNRRSARGLALGPRATLEVLPTDALSLFASYGRGFRSPQARALVDGESVPFAIADSAEVGARGKWGQRDELSARLAAFYTHLSHDLEFDPQEGSLGRIGPTTRWGVAAQAEARPWSWALASLSATWVRATLDEPEPGERERLPYVPPLVLRADLGAHGDLFTWLGAAVRGRAGVGASWVSPRPLPFGDSSDAVGLLDVSGSIGWRALTLGVEVFNLLDAEYASSVYAFASDWRQTARASSAPALHFVAGAPRALLLTLEIRL
jgi:TonB family protein